MQRDTGEFKLRVERSLAKIEQIESSCPIRDVQSSIHAIQVDAAEAKAVALAAKGESKRLAAIISAGITAVGGTIAAFFGWRGGSN